MHISKLVLICCSLLLLLSRSRIYNTTSYLHEQQSKIDFPSLPPCNRGFTKPNVKGPPIVWTLYDHTNDLVREGGTNMALSLRSQYSTKLTLNLVSPLTLQTLQFDTNHKTFPWYCHVSSPHWLGPCGIPRTSLHGKGTSTSESTLRTGIKESIPFRADEEREYAV